MIDIFRKSRVLISCLVFSVLVHFLFFYAARMFGTFNFTGPVNQSRGVVVDLSYPNDTVSPVAHPGSQGNRLANRVREADNVVKNPSPEREEDNDTPSAHPEQRQAEPEPTNTPAAVTETNSSTQSSAAPSAKSPDESRKLMLANSISSPLRTAGEFMATKNEKLTYVISLLGLP